MPHASSRSDGDLQVRRSTSTWTGAIRLGRLAADGVLEARSPAGDFFGLAPLVGLLTHNLAGALPTPETMRRVVRAVLARPQARLNDDTTLLLERRSSAEQTLRP